MTTLRILHRVAELRQAILAFRRQGDSIGLVPTMGALHEGHLSLARAARADCARVVATIFVNPTQFGASEDLGLYPRDAANDVALLHQEHVDLLFAPETGEMYPPGFATSISVEGLTRQLCGPFRPGHFAGVATVVAKLLLMAMPDRAYFGEKDFQQLQVIRQLARDLNIPVEIVGVPTVREADGLALSSRNRYLENAERERATLLPALMRETALALADGRGAATLLEAGKARLMEGGFGAVDYLELCDSESLAPIPGARGTCRLFVAAWLGRTRLIDNWPVLG